MASFASTAPSSSSASHGKGATDVATLTTADACQTAEFHCASGGVAGSYVALRQPSSLPITVAEVEIFGVPAGWAFDGDETLSPPASEFYIPTNHMPHNWYASSPCPEGHLAYGFVWNELDARNKGELRLRCAAVRMTDQLDSTQPGAPRAYERACTDVTCSGDPQRGGALRVSRQLLLLVHEQAVELQSAQLGAPLRVVQARVARGEAPPEC